MKDAPVSVTLSQPRRLAFCLLGASPSLTSSQHSLNSPDLQAVWLHHLLRPSCHHPRLQLISARTQVNFYPVVTNGGSLHSGTVHGSPN